LLLDSKRGEGKNASLPKVNLGLGDKYIMPANTEMFADYIEVQFQNLFFYRKGRRDIRKER
jgi:hypothetical protein